MAFDARRAFLRGPDLFRRFRVPERVEALVRAGLAPDDVLLVAERDGARRAFLARELAYHHVAQGELAGLPYLVTF
jgi:hypothetical protein